MGLNPVFAIPTVVCFFGRPFVKWFALCYGTIVCPVCLLVTLVYCGHGQTVGWIKMKLGTEVGLGPSHIVLDGDPAPPKRHSPLGFQLISVVAKAGWIKMPLYNSPFPQIDIIGAMVIVWRAREKIIRSVLCSIVCNNCTLRTAHT